MSQCGRIDNPLSKPLNFYTAPLEKGPQVISFAALPDTEWNASAIPLIASTSSKLPVTFSVTGPAEVHGSNLSLLPSGVGLVAVTAHQAGNDLYREATATVRFNVTKVPQTVTFAPIPDRTTDNTPIRLVASASSGQSVTFSVASGTATISVDDQLAVCCTGTVVVVAKQAGTAILEAAQASQTVTFKPNGLTPPCSFIGFNGESFSIAFRGEAGRAYVIETINAFGDVWQEITTVNGDGPGTDTVVPLPQSLDKVRYYRVRLN